jgi:hypothetical protein
MKIGIGIQPIFKVLPQQFECYNVGITDGRDLRLKWAQMK